MNTLMPKPPPRFVILGDGDLTNNTNSSENNIKKINNHIPSLEVKNTVTNIQRLNKYLS